MGRHPPYSRPKHLLMALLFLKVYSTEEVHAYLEQMKKLLENGVGYTLV